MLPNGLFGKIDLDKTFEERESINAQVVDSIDQAAQAWGVKVLRYEVKDILPPESVKKAMEAQMTAERAEAGGYRQIRGGTAVDYQPFRRR